MAKFRKGNCPAAVRYTSVTVKNDETGEDELRSVPLWDFSRRDHDGILEVTDPGTIEALIREGAELVEEEVKEEVVE